MPLPALRSLICRSFLSRSFAALLILSFPILSSSTWLHAQETAFGGIELASTSVKGLTFIFEPGAESTGAAGTARPERMKRLQYAERNTNFISMRDGCKLSPKGLDLLVKNASEVVSELREGAKTKNLGTVQLYGVASSGLAVCNKEEVSARVQAATGLCLNFISASDEARFSLGFVLPRDRYRSLIIDIGGGNTKAGYYVVTKGANWPPREWHGMEIEYGTRTLRDKALALTKAPTADGRPAPDFYAAVDQVLRTEVGPRLEALKMENSALQNFSSVYMVGGVIWATSSRMRPVQQQEWAINSLSLSDFDQALADIRDNTFGEFSGTEFGPRVSAKTREDADNELRDVLQRFDPQSLYAGVSLARFLIRETTPSARLFFPTTAAWISGYAREKFRETGKSVNSCVATPVTSRASTQP